MQAQSQASTSAHPAQGYHAPTQPKIPMNHVQSLIPRLTTTINDIDSFRNLLAQGGQDGSMPDWDVTLQRYSLLLGRITALSNYISQPPPTPVGGRTPLPNSQKPALQSHLVHPLNPLPPPGPEVSPFAPDVYFQVLNTLPLPPLSSAQEDLLSRPGWTSGSELKKMSESELEGLERRLKDRLKRESGRAKGLVEEVEKRSGEVDWTMRVDVEGEDDDGSLFGGDSDDEGDKGENTSPKQEAKEPSKPNPREGWTIQDYVKYMESGTKPTTASRTDTLVS